MRNDTAAQNATKTTIHRDGDAIVIDIPMNLRRRPGRKEIVLTPDRKAIYNRNELATLENDTATSILAGSNPPAEPGNTTTQAKPIGAHENEAQHDGIKRGRLG